MRRPGKKKPLLADGVRFECVEGCTKCCAIPGVVYVFRGEIPAMAEFFDMDIDSFMDEYLRHHWADVYELDFPDQEPCMFLEDEGCAIYEVRPEQCRTFPFWPDNVKDASLWKGVKRLCPGVGRGRTYDYDEIQEIVERINRGPFAN